jgi:hypothetical protein
MMTTSINTNQGVRTTGSTGEYRDYFGTTASGGYGTGTVALVYNPGFATLASTISGEGSKQKPTRAQVLFASGNFSGSTALSIYLPDRTNPGDLTLSLGIVNATQSAFLNTGTGFTWDANQWYMIGASWAQGAPASIYVRALTGPTTNTSYFANSSAPLTLASGPAAAAVTAGFSFGFSPNTWGGLGDYALVRAYNDYTGNQPIFDSLYVNLFIPEPATGLLMGVGGVLLWRRRHS